MVADNDAIGSPYASSGGADTTVPTLVADPTVQAIADKHGATPAQVLINWAVQRNTIVIPKSENLDRMTVNITVSQALSEISFWF